MNTFFLLHFLRRSAVGFLLVLSTGNLQAQTDFNHYSTLRAVGPIPADFSRKTYDKLAEDIAIGREDLTRSQTEDFLTGIHYSIDEMLHSGYVIYGDRLSNFVGQVADKLLKDDAALRASLRFYILKSADVNAFSTDQGIVFVTTGLLAQITSEAQLAYILGHEIGHYVKHHVVETYDWRMSTGNYRRTKNFTNYAREKEFDADKMGVDYFNHAGYAKSEIRPTFDVLMYSYLPFDEQPFPLDYFQTDMLYIPPYAFPADEYPLKAKEDYDDEDQTHPNIQKRKDAIDDAIAEHLSWGSVVSYLPEAEFLEVRRIARFETVRLQVAEAQYVKALYSIFLLEKEVPNSLYLDRMKAQAWLGLTQFKEAGKFSETYIRTAKLEGKSGPLHYFIGKLPKDGVYAMSLRTIYDLKKKHPEDREINAIMNRLIEVLAIEEKFELKKFAPRTFEEQRLRAAAELAAASRETDAVPTSSKNDRIRQKNMTPEIDIKFDSTSFYLYGISDIVTDSAFVEEFKNKRSEVRKKWSESVLLSEYSDEKFTYFDYVYEVKSKEDKSVLAKKLIMAEPEAEIPSGNHIDRELSERLAEELGEIILEVAERLQVEVKAVDRKEIADKGTGVFNDRTVIQQAFYQLGNEKVVTFPVDYSLIDSLSSTYGSGQILFSLVNYRKKGPTAIGVVASCFVFPVLAVYLPIKIFTRHNTTLTTIIYDVEKGYLVQVNEMTCKSPLRKLILKGYVYDYFKQLKDQ